MTGTRTHTGLVGDAAVEELAEACWPVATRSAAADWFDLSADEQLRLTNAIDRSRRLGASCATSGTPPPWPVDLLYVPSPGGDLPFIGPSSVRPWLDRLHPRPGEQLHVFRISTACYERASIASMRCGERLEFEPVISPFRGIMGLSAVVEPRALRVITHLRETKLGIGRPISTQAVHLLVPWQTVASVTMVRSHADGHRDGQAAAETRIRLAFNDGWRICHLEMGSQLGERGITDDDQQTLLAMMLDAIADTQGQAGVSATGSSHRSGQPCESKQIVEFRGAVRFGLAGS